MPIAITDAQVALTESLRTWAERARPVEEVRAAESEPVSGRAPWWGQLAGIGLFGIALPEDLGGAGGSVVDAAAGLEEAAAALVPGPALPTALAAIVLGATSDCPAAKELAPRLASGSAVVATGLDPTPVRGAESADGGLRASGDVGLVLGAGADAHLLLSARMPDGDRWFVLPSRTPGVDVEPVPALDFSRSLARVRLTDVAVPSTAVVEGLATDTVRDLALALAAAEASGIAGWCLRTAADYAKVREQFGRAIGSFQAVKHLCAQMLCRAETAAALAWDAARAAEAGGDQLAFAAAAAGAGALDAAVDNAKDCIQVLGGIGFTWEHDAHLYLRRAVALRQLAGGSRRWRERVAELTGSGVRRRIALDVEGPEGFRDEVRAELAGIAELPDADRRAALAERGYLAPHWPKPYGRAASPAEQLVIDSEVDRAGVVRPNLQIGAWAVPTILRHGTAEQVEKFVGPTLRGELTWCQLFSEPEAGSDLAALRTKAVRADGGWRLTGQKVWTSLADQADRAICLARTDPDAPKHRGITYFLVDMRAPGIEIRPLREITGEARFNEVFLTEVFVPDADVVGEVDGGWKLARSTLADERVALSSGSSLGESLERLLGAVRARDIPEGSDALGRLITQGAAGNVLDLRAVLRQLAGQPGAESSVRKLLGVWHRQDVAELALEMLGPDAAADTADTHAVLHEFLLSRCLSIAGGTTQVLLNVVAERLLGLPRD